MCMALSSNKPFGLSDRLGRDPVVPRLEAELRQTTRRSHSLAIGRAVGVDPQRSLTSARSNVGPCPLTDLAGGVENWPSWVL
jgi:hypothetical protein